MYICVCMCKEYTELNTCFVYLIIYFLNKLNDFHTNLSFCSFLPYIKMLFISCNPICTYLRSWALPEKLPIVQSPRNSQHLKEPKGSSPCSQEPSTGPYPEPDRSNPHHPILSLYDLTTLYLNTLKSGTINKTRLVIVSNEASYAWFTLWRNIDMWYVHICFIWWIVFKNLHATEYFLRKNKHSANREITYVLWNPKLNSIHSRARHWLYHEPDESSQHPYIQLL
jgi:hypothetical protein